MYLFWRVFLEKILRITHFLSMGTSYYKEEKQLMERLILLLRRILKYCSSSNSSSFVVLLTTCGSEAEQKALTIHKWLVATELSSLL